MLRTFIIGTALAALGYAFFSSQSSYAETYRGVEFRLQRATFEGTGGGWDHWTIEIPGFATDFPPIAGKQEAIDTARAFIDERMGGG